MGVVWKGRHVEQDVPVAIKFLTEEGARDPLYLGCLKNEVRKVATLDHPGIVRVYDHGAVPVGLEVHGLAPGSPFLVMEWAEGGTLSRHCGKMSWDQAWRTLMRLLDGLAHAHARGVVHRDLKPGNVLLRRDSGGVVLTDFGLARAGDTDGGAVLNAGTPTYMAPEQIQQLAHEIGPWTDMYALGCLAWSLVCGRPPFVRDSIEDTLDAHLNDPVPEFCPSTPVPPGFDAWVRQLLRKAPHQRFVRAADAAFSLAKLAPLEEQNSLLVEPVFAKDAATDEVSNDSARTESVTLDDTRVMGTRKFSKRRSGSSTSALPAVGRSLLWAERGELPPIPDDWKEEHPPRPVAHLLGTGLGMYGFRSFPLVGRDQEQDHLWSELKASSSHLHTRAVVLAGADGAGKSHLAQWLARRGYEVGANIVLRAQFRALDTRDPLVPLLSSLLGCEGLDRPRTQTQIRKSLEVLGECDDTEVETLMTVLGPFPGETYSPELMDERNDVRFTVVRRILHRFSLLRPMVVVLDDAHHSPDAIRFAETLMSSQTSGHPLLLIVTINTVTIDDELRERLEDFKGRQYVSTLEVGPLKQEHRSTLVRTLLGLEPTLAALVERRSGGNPQFAVQLVGDWIQKDMLIHGQGGFMLRPGLRPEFPADMQAMWGRRLAAAIPADLDTRCLQVAAELGMEVNADEWLEACETLGIVAERRLVDRLIDAHLARTGSKKNSWTFSHAMVRQSLKRAAEFEGNRVSHHHAVAEMLVRRGVDGPRLGRHLFEAGDYEAAIPALLEGAQQSFHSARNVVGWELLSLRERALSQLSIPDTDLRWAQGWMLKERFLARRKEFPAVMGLVDKILEKTENTPDAKILRATAWLRKGTIHRLMSEPDEARFCLNKAMTGAVDDPAIMAQTMEQMATLELMYGNPMLSANFFESAHDAAKTLGDQDRVFQIRQNMAAVYRQQGDTEKARAHLAASLAYYQKTGQKRAQSRSLNDLAELDRLSGDLARAEAGYREALNLLEALGDQRFYIAALNLGIIYAETGRPVEARFQLEQCQQALKASRLPGIEGATYLCLAFVHAQLQSLEDWRICFDAGRKQILETGFADIDVARSAQMGGEAMLKNGWTAEARESLEFSQRHWRSLGREDKAKEINTLLSGI